MSEAAVALGARLKAERERRGLSAAKAADELHLDGWVIDALEADDYARVGPSVYAKGHLKRYALLLGLPAAEIIAGYESRAQTPNSAASTTTNVRLRADAPDVSNLPWPQIAGCVAVALLVLGVLWWKPWHQRGAVPPTAVPLAENRSTAASDNSAAPDHAGASDNTEASSNIAALDNAAASPGALSASNAAYIANSPGSTAPSPTRLSLTSSKAVGGASPGGGGGGGSAAVISAAQPGSSAAAGPASDSTAANAATGGGRARLRLSFSADSWVDVRDATGRRAFAGNGRANSVKVILGAAPMRVYLGFASGVQLEINDHAVAIGSQFVAGDVARFEAGADGILRRDSRGGGAAPAGAPAAQVHNARPAG